MRQKTPPWEELTDAQKREYTKDLVAYELLKKISKERSYLEVEDIIGRMERQLVYWRDRAPCELAPVALDRYGAEITPPIAGTIESILKKERYQGNRKYKRPRSIEATGPED